MRVLLFGADGGGSKTTGIIADQSGVIVAEHTGGPTNPNVVGVDMAVASLADVVSACCRQAACSLQDIRGAVVGLAGASREAVRDRLQREIQRRLGEQFSVVIETDARVALEGAFAGNPGVVIIAGTGSVVIGKGEDGDVSMVGGWGRVLGDEGSGFFLGCEALRFLAACYDGRAQDGLLAKMLKEETGLHSRDQILTRVYEEGFDMAKLAPYVLQAADQDDATALRIVRAGAEALTVQTQALVQRLRLSGDIPVALHGGLLQNENVYRTILTESVRERVAKAVVCSPRHSPAYGAVLMAMKFL